MSYDSRPDTYAHIATVRGYINRAVVNLLRRGDDHDLSKLESPEREVFDEFTPKLKDSTYGSDEYKAFLRGMGEGLQHHYAHNSHHPEHHEGGFWDMTLLDMVEMLCDWKAATLRHADGDLLRSIEQNCERFGYGGAMARVLTRTAEELGLIDEVSP
jgi:Family of unknown function (DUF5662)